MTIVLNCKRQRKRAKPRPTDPHAFESVGSILRRLRGEAEALMTPTFDRPLSLRIDFLVAAEQRVTEEWGD